jgi:hypothetical protein
MKSNPEAIEDRLEGPRSNEQDGARAAVLQELEKILASRFFRSASRGKQFLRDIVQQKLEGHSELLKERLIGAELFHREPSYATGEDPVVRVQAGDVRRRLEPYYQTASPRTGTETSAISHARCTDRLAATNNCTGRQRVGDALDRVVMAKLKRLLRHEREKNKCCCAVQA